MFVITIVRTTKSVMEAYLYAGEALTKKKKKKIKDPIKSADCIYFLRVVYFLISAILLYMHFFYAIPVTRLFGPVSPSLVPTYFFRSDRVL